MKFIPEEFMEFKDMILDALGIGSKDLPEKNWTHRESLTVRVNGNKDKNRRAVSLNPGKYCLVVLNTNDVPFSHPELVWTLSNSEDEGGPVELRNKRSARIHIKVFSTSTRTKLELRFTCKTASDVLGIGSCKVAFGIVDLSA